MWIVDAADVFEPFLKAYVEEFKYKSINTDDWKQFLYKFFHDKVHSAVLFCVFVLLVTLHEGNTSRVFCSVFLQNLTVLSFVKFFVHVCRKNCWIRWNGMTGFIKLGCRHSNRGVCF